MGTMLQRHGLKLGEIPELLAITNPDLLTNIHRQYIEAGTEIVYANTFGANRRKMQKTPYTVADVVSAAIAAAKKACIGTSARVALDIGPLGELLEPMGTLPFETAVDMFAEIVDAGVNAGADLICIETMTDLYEAKAALLAAKEHSTLPVWVTMSFDATGRTFTGCTIPSMARTLEGLGADAIGLNCSQGPKQLLPLFQELCRVTTLPVIAKPNAGLPDPVDGHYDLPPEEFARTMVDVVGAGVSIVGGCCGTNPDYIRALHDAVHTMTPGARDIHHGSFLCTPTMPLEISGVRVIGERINPTGKKRFQQALLAGDLDYTSMSPLRRWTRARRFWTSTLAIRAWMKSPCSRAWSGNCRKRWMCRSSWIPPTPPRWKPPCASITAKRRSTPSTAKRKCCKRCCRW